MIVFKYPLSRNILDREGAELLKNKSINSTTLNYFYFLTIRKSLKGDHSKHCTTSYCVSRFKIYYLFNLY